jgi:hypothetical protein
VELSARGSLPASFDPYSTANIVGNAFRLCGCYAHGTVGVLDRSPCLQCAQTKYFFTVAAQQYCSVAELLLALVKPLLLDGGGGSQAFPNLGLAYSNNDVTARVNAFGPLSLLSALLSRLW